MIVIKLFSPAAMIINNDIKSYYRRNSFDGFRSRKTLDTFLNLHNRENSKYLTSKQLETVLTDMFDLLNIPKPSDGLARRNRERDISFQ